VNDKSNAREGDGVAVPLPEPSCHWSPPGGTYGALYTTAELRAYGDAREAAIEEAIAALAAPKEAGDAPFKLMVEHKDGVVAAPSKEAGAEYDRSLIAEMLDAYRQHEHCDMDLIHLESGIEEQAELLRDADNRDAAGVRTVNLSAGKMLPDDFGMPTRANPPGDQRQEEFVCICGMGIAPCQVHRASPPPEAVAILDLRKNEAGLIYTVPSDRLSDMPLGKYTYTGL
jgi:hypothetical protein